MPHAILVNNEIYHFGENDLPCLITYREKAGGSQFTVSLVADLFLHGSKILFFTAYPSARENFLEQITGAESKTTYVESKTDIKKCKDSQVIMLKSGNENLFLSVLEQLTDIKERVVLVKNMEVFGSEVFDACLSLQKIILSGNIDACVAKKQIAEKQYGTIIIFSPPETPLPVTVPPLQKYSGYLWTHDKEGNTTIRIER